jgi:hypothetical protein
MLILTFTIACPDYCDECIISAGEVECTVCDFNYELEDGACVCKNKIKA